MSIQKKVQISRCLYFKIHGISKYQLLSHDQIVISFLNSLLFSPLPPPPPQVNLLSPALRDAQLSGCQSLPVPPRGPPPSSGSPPALFSPGAAAELGGGGGIGGRGVTLGVCRRRGAGTHPCPPRGTLGWAAARGAETRGKRDLEIGGRVFKRM